MNFKNAIYAGMMIGLGGLIYLSVENKYLGAFLFSFGLLTIVYKGYALYTGRIYSLELHKDNILDKLIILLGNLVGAFIIGGLVRIVQHPTSDILWQTKLSHTWYTVIILSILCGILMYLAVSLYAKTQNPITIILPIMIFILSGCEHCVANMFYFAIASNITWDMAVYILLNIIGNTIGSVLWYRLEKEND